ncbi:unnamed protein product [Cyprideis torosa]|uniref:DNA primase large subunit n=1 Tax=Cyprideis torosa TaxID=163714 RepID=A0A7R8WF24_9CRUS|nr:unnamed protein product [Cyprideis torosa]CAG0894978.1 unnamed protein product [Cyprideis torosa]
MDFKPGARKKRRKGIRLIDEPPTEIADCGVSLYQSPPTDLLDSCDVETLLQERMKLLNMVALVSERKHRSVPEFVAALENEIRSDPVLKPYARLSGTSVDVDQYRLRDLQSHYFLCLAMCKSEEKRRWLVKNEADLFVLRFHIESLQGRKKFLEISRFPFKMVSEEEKKALAPHLVKWCQADTLEAASKLTMYRVPFRYALALVSKLKVFIHRGMAFIEERELVHVIKTIFKDRLMVFLKTIPYYMSRVEEDQALKQVLERFEARTDKESSEFNHSASGTSVRRQELDMLAEESFPLCMRFMHRSLRETHHLKHMGRMQYGLFLKWIGVPLEESIELFKEEFGKVRDPTKFDRTYGYSIRHNYGKEGKRVNYSAYNCESIAKAVPGAGEVHGCPFKNMDNRMLRTKLKGLKEDDIQSILAQTDPKMRCSMFFQFSHGLEKPHSVISHPNGYFLWSRMVRQDDRFKKMSAPQGRPSTGPSPSDTSLMDTSAQESKDIPDDWGTDDLGDLEDLDVMLKGCS